MDRRSSRILAYLYSFKLIEHPGRMAGCTRQISPTNIYQHLAVTIAFFYISLVLLITLYAIILIKLKKHTHPGEHSANAEEQRSRRNWDVLNMAFVTFLCFFFAGSLPFQSGQYYILHRTVAFGSLAILYHTITLTTSWSPQTAPSNGLCASFLAVIIASI